MTEIWVVILECPSYEISSLGRIRNEKSKILKPYKFNGYSKIKLVHPLTNKRIHVLVHRLVATAFIPREHGENEVNHINGKRSDNRSSNLEWTSREENIRMIKQGHGARIKISLRLVLEIYDNNKNLSTEEFKKLLLKY